MDDYIMLLDELDDIKLDHKVSVSGFQIIIEYWALSKSYAISYDGYDSVNTESYGKICTSFVLEEKMKYILILASYLHFDIKNNLDI